MKKTLLVIGLSMLSASAAFAQKSRHEPPETDEQMEERLAPLYCRHYQTTKVEIVSANEEVGTFSIRLAPFVKQPVDCK